MITEKDLKARIAEILTERGFNVVANEVDEGYRKPAVFVSVMPSIAKLNLCGGATEEITLTVELRYITAHETDEECVDVANLFKQIFLYKPLEIDDRNLTITEIEFDIDNSVLYTYFDITFIQAIIDTAEEFEPIENLTIGGNV